MIERLTAGLDADLDRVGGKAAGLVRLLDAGLDVPPAWVLPTEASASPESRATAIASLADWWTDVEQDFPGSRWAVRSSAVAEDLEGASFAGVYETRLGLASLDEIREAVADCWAALDQERAQVYRERQGLTESGIALVVQRLIEPTCAGVLLTVDPLHPFAEHVVIDASWGLGEAVVSGQTDPDHVVLDRATGAVVSERLGAKTIEHVYDGGVQVREVDDVRRAQRCLTDADLVLLHDLATRVGAQIGPRRDLEWAIEDGHLHVLQDRPVTGLPAEDPEDVLSRRFGDEYLADYQTRLSFALMGPWMVAPMFDEKAELEGRPELIGKPTMSLYDGYVYFSGAYLREVARGLPVSQRIGTPLQTWFPQRWADQVMAVKFRPRLFVNTMLAPGRDKGRGGLKENLPALQRHCDAVRDEISPLLEQDYTSLTEAQWREQFAQVDGFGLDHFRVIRWTMGHYNVLLHGTLEKLLGSWAGEDAAEIYQQVIGGLPGTHTAQINRDVFALAATARADEALRALILGDDGYRQIKAASPGSPFWPEFDGFLSSHGHRSSTRVLDATRWREEPELVFGLIRAQVRPEVAPEDPAAGEQRREAARRAAETTVLARIGRPRASVLRWVMSRTQEFTVARENQRYYLDYLLFHLRQLVLEQGRRAVERGALLDRDDILLTDADDFWLLVASGETPADGERIRADVESARTHRERHLNRLPATYLFDGVPTEAGETTTTEHRDGALVGLGACAGQARGVVRLVRSLGDLADVQPGDVLVASNIDPGWTSVFPMIAALVTETGGILSHGAILAREYGVPTVTCVTDAMTLLTSGMQVEVDGSAGVVVLAEADGQAASDDDIEVLGPVAV